MSDVRYSNKYGDAGIDREGLITPLSSWSVDTNLHLNIITYYFRTISYIISGKKVISTRWYWQ